MLVHSYWIGFVWQNMLCWWPKKKPHCNTQQDANNKETKQKNSDLNPKLEICLCEVGSSTESKIGMPLETYALRLLENKVWRRILGPKQEQVTEGWEQLHNKKWINSSCLVSWGAVRLSQLGMSATNWPIVPVPDDGWWRMWSSQWNENWQRKPKYSEKTCPSVILSTTNPTCTELGSNLGCCSGKQATNRLSYGMTKKRGNLGNLSTEGRILWTLIIKTQGVKVETRLKLIQNKN
jgi:hypothetical protein